MSVFNYKQRNNIVLAILIILAAFIIYSLRIIAGTLLTTVVMYTILRPLYLHLTRQWHWRRIGAAASLIAGSFVIIVLPILTLTLMVINKINDFQRDSFKIRIILSRIDDFMGSKLKQPDLFNNLTARFKNFIGDLFPSILGGAFDIALGVTVMYFLLYFMFIRHEEFENSLLKYSPFQEQNSRRFAEELKNTTYSNVLGQGFIAFVQGALLSIGFFIFGIPDAIFWGVIATFLSFLPIIGAPVIFIPAAVITIVQGDTFNGVGLLLWGLILITNIDNVIRFIIARKVADTHPIITVIGVIIGIPAFGIIGLVFGPLLLSYFILTVRIYETSRMATERLEKMKHPDEKNYL
ncbi:AI-2E family transporter (plasmid) [Pedobacter sp. BS3]|uniref:AI-2E family transporter n=1 Tax=Pedobacter sp. BS3 TaxID=2567937 RepID=UPI0011ECA977|nr:AI-2E family transporter [Pedobacter sp. BS3]TZF85736.1 AI-2E family transporter [Pedobacter sp. BS3]